MCLGHCTGAALAAAEAGPTSRVCWRAGPLGSGGAFCQRLSARAPADVAPTGAALVLGAAVAASVWPEAVVVGAGMQDAVCREIALAQQLFLLQTRDAPGDKAALKAALLADVFSNGASRLVACAPSPASAQRVSSSRYRRSRAAVCALLRAPGMERRRCEA